jgi:hypothetical protein
MSLLGACTDDDWIAIDSIGHIGWFCMAASPFLPKYYWNDEDVLKSAVEFISSFPFESEATMVVDKEEGLSYDTWIECARRGAYGYDYNYEVGAYQLITTPTNPRTASDNVKTYGLMPFFSGVFGEGGEIDPHSVLTWVPLNRAHIQ